MEFVRKLRILSAKQWHIVKVQIFGRYAYFLAICGVEFSQGVASFFPASFFLSFIFIIFLLGVGGKEGN